MGSMQELLSQGMETGSLRKRQNFNGFPPGRIIFRSIQKGTGGSSNSMYGKIADAIFKAARAIGAKISNWRRWHSLSPIIWRRRKDRDPTVEEVQDAVEKVLIETGHAKPPSLYPLP